VSETQQLLSSEELATYCAAQIRAAFADCDVAIGEDRLVVERNGRLQPFDLERLTAAYRQAPAELDVLLTNLVSAISAPPPERTLSDFERLRSRILPMLKPAGLLNEADRRGLPRPAARPFLAELIITYVIEEPQRLVYLNENHLERWAIGAQHLHEAALPNLQQRTIDRARFTISGDAAQPLIVASSGDAFDATRILLPELLENWQRHMPGNLLLAVPHRDLLLAFSDDDGDVVERIAAQVRRDAVTANGLTDRLFCLIDGELRVYADE
jgi:uncharacterized protein YtpQ (UPF0354 family)